MIIGDTPVQLGQIEAADAMMIDGKIVTRDDYRALAATVEALRETARKAAETLGFLSHHLRGRMGDAALMDMAEKADALNEALAATPQQHLAEIKAQHERSGFITGAEQFSNPDTVNLASIAAAADLHADSIRQEKK